MRAALVTETYPPEVNGVARTLHRLVGELRGRGHEIEVIRPRQPGAEDAAGESEWPVPGLPLPGYAGLRFGLPVALRLRNRWARGPRPEIVHVATEGPLGLAAIAAAKWLGVPVGSSFHTNFHQYSRHYRLGWLRRPAAAYLRRFHNATAGTAVPTTAMRDALSAEGFERLAVVGRGVDADAFGPGFRSPELRRAWGADARTPVVAYVGRVAAEKNVGLAVRAFEAIRRQRPAARLVVVGDGPFAEQLAALAPDAIRCGMQSGADLARHYASADLLLAPSLTETFGNVVTEAMASGLAVVTFDYAAGREHIRHGVDGMLAPYGDEAAFVSAAETAAAMGDGLARMGAAAEAKARELGWDRVGDALERFWAAASARPDGHDNLLGKTEWVGRRANPEI